MKTSIRRTAFALLAAVIVGAAWWAAASRTQVDQLAVVSDPTPRRRDAPNQRTPRRRPAADAPAADGADPLDEMSDAPPAATGAKRVLRIVDGQGAPIPGVYVRRPGRIERTDLRGEVSLVVDAVSTVEFFDRDEERSVELREAVTEVAVDRFPTIEVEFIDGSTGAWVSATKWRTRVSSGDWTDDRHPRLPIERRWEAKAEVVIDPPDGFGALDPFAWSGYVADRATRVRLAVPVFPARGVRLLAVDEAKRPVAGAKLLRNSVRIARVDGNVSVTFRASRSDGDGLLVVAGVPRIPYCKMHVTVSCDCGDEPRFWFFGGVDGIALDGPASDEPTTVVLVKGVGNGRGMCGGAGSGNNSGSRKADGETASVLVRVAYRDATPAASVNVGVADVFGTTGRDGVVRLDAVPVGRHDVIARAHGFLPTVVSVDVGHDSEVLVRETRARTVRVEVVDDAGKPLPAACVTAISMSVPGSSGESVSAYCSIAQLDGDVETLAPLTDRDGVVSLAAPVGAVEYRATLGAADEKTTSSADVVRITLHPPKD